MGKLLRRSAGVLFIWPILVSGTFAYDSWSSGAQRTQWIEINGHVLAANGSRQSEHPKHSHSSAACYLLLHRQGSLVLQGLAGQPTLPYPRLWLKGEDHMFDRLLTEERLFVEVRISGLLREYQPDTGILELGHIEVVPGRSHKSIAASGPGA